jgi:hypothetical protein
LLPALLDSPVNKPQRRRIDALAAPYRVADGEHFRREHFAPDPLRDVGRELADERGTFLREGLQLLAEMQEKPYAQDRWAVA